MLKGLVEKVVFLLLFSCFLGLALMFDLLRYQGWSFLDLSAIFTLLEWGINGGILNIEWIVIPRIRFFLHIFCIYGCVDFLLEVFRRRLGIFLWWLNSIGRRWHSLLLILSGWFSTLSILGRCKSLCLNFIIILVDLKILKRLIWCFFNRLMKWQPILCMLRILWWKHHWWLVRLNLRYLGQILLGLIFLLLLLNYQRWGLRILFLGPIRLFTGL